MPKINRSRNKVLNLKNAIVSYDSKLDRVLFTIISKSHRLGKIEVEIKRNSHEDREFRKMLLSKGFISDEGSAALSARRIIPKFPSIKDMPVPLHDDEYTLGQGKRGKDIIWKSILYPHMFRKKELPKSLVLKAKSQSDYEREVSHGGVTEDDNFQMGYLDNQLWVFVNRKDGRLGSPEFRFTIELNSKNKKKLLEFLKPKKRR